jgi:putative endonuclease
MNKGNYYVYITTNPRKTVLYTGITNNLKQREIEHFQNRGNRRTFAGRYYCYKFLYYEHFSDIHQAIYREKEIKKMSRTNKLRLIRTKNPQIEFLVLNTY